MSQTAQESPVELRKRLQAEATVAAGLVSEGGKIVLSPRTPVSLGLRVLPIVIIALVGLLCFKMIGMVNNGGYAFPFGSEDDPHPFANFGPTLARWTGVPFVDPIVTGSLGGETKEEEKKPETEDKAVAEAAEKPAEGTKPAEGEKAAEGEKPAGEAAPKDAAAAADGTSPLAGSAAVATSKPIAPPSESERALMLRLQERRETLQKRSEEIDMREGLLAAAEKRLEDRIKDLQSAEEGEDPAAGMATDGKPAQPGVAGQPSATAKKSDARPAIRNLVTVYETMRPKDAARVFETLEGPVLIEVARQLNPRKMAEIMSLMTPDSAAKLTVALASDAPPKKRKAPEGAPGLPAGELPRLPVANGANSAAQPTP